MQPTWLCPLPSNTISLQTFADDVVAVTFQIFPKDAFYHFSFFLVDDELSVFILVISKKASGADVYLPLLVAVLKSKFNVLRKTLTFLLSQRCHDSEHHLPFGIKCVDTFLLEIYRDVLILELSYIFKTVQGITGKTADGLGNHHVDFAGHAVIDKPVKLNTVFGVGS